MATTTLAEEMLVFRAKNRMSQTEFAKRVGVTLQTICYIEQGKQTPTRVTETKIRLAMQEGDVQKND